MYPGVELVGHILGCFQESALGVVHLTRAHRPPLVMALSALSYYSINQVWLPFFRETMLEWSSFVFFLFKKLTLMSEGF